MMKIILGLITIWSVNAFAIPCDCEVRVLSPLTGSYQMQPNVMKVYQLEEFSTYSKKNIQSCRQSCYDEFQKDMPAERLNALLLTYSAQLIEQKQLGFNCTGLTTLKYPVKVRAKLGAKGLGNVADIVQVINHEEECFN